MIYITGDTHGEQNRLIHIFQNSGISWSANDYLIICGDFGFIFSGKEYETVFLDYLAEKIAPTVLFIDGNHENFDLLNAYPVEIWRGGKIHKIRRNIIHLMRGQVFEIEGKSFFALGGAYSIDKRMRQENITWWEHEMPSQDEYDESIKNLAEHGNKVNYILSHTAPSETLVKLYIRNIAEELQLNTFLDYVRDIVVYDHWYFGHFHNDGYAWRNQTGVYYDLISIADNL